MPPRMIRCRAGWSALGALLLLPALLAVHGSSSSNSNSSSSRTAQARATFLSGNPAAWVRRVPSTLRSTLQGTAALSIHLIWVAPADFPQQLGVPEVTLGLTRYLYGLSGSGYMGILTSHGIQPPAITAVAHHYPDVSALPTGALASDATLLYALLARAQVPQVPAGSLFVLMRLAPFVNAVGNAW
jgi:hypothetical protein